MKIPATNALIINLNERKDRKTHMKKQISKFLVPKNKKKNKRIKNKTPVKLNIKFHTVQRSELGGVIGCATSHIDCIKIAMKNKWPAVWIMEDDVNFKASPHDAPLTIDDEWDMLYFGHNVHDLMEDERLGDSSRPWKRMKSACANHCYIVHSRIYEEYLTAEDEISAALPIDVFIAGKMDRWRCYGLYPPIAMQLKGESNIEEKTIDYDYLLDKKFIRECEYEKNDEDGLVYLKLPSSNSYPHVTVITPTKNRTHFLPFTHHNLNKQNYPRDKIEWIILHEDDDVQVGGDDERVRLVDMRKFDNYKEESCTIAAKRNMGCKLASHDIIVHMDDDDIYQAEYIHIAVRMLTQTDCVGCTKIGCYNLKTGDSYETGTRTLDTMAEASLAYKRDFWRERQWNDLMVSGEGIKFIEGRQDKCIQIPYQYLLIAMTHNDNITGLNRFHENLKSEDSYYDHMPPETQKWIKYLYQKIYT